MRSFIRQTSNQSISCSRIGWVDYAKGIGIILVVIAHIFNQCGTFQELSKLIYSFHMPLFFILSGYVISDKTRSLNFVQLLTKYTRSLLLPYWFYTLANIIISLLGKQDFSRETVSRYLWNFLFFRGWNATWFLPALFVSLLAAIILLKHFSIKKNLLLCFALGLALMAIPLHPNVIKVFLLGAIALPFVLMGYSLKHTHFLKWPLWIFILMTIIWLIVAYINGKADMVNYRFGNIAALWILTSLLGSLVLFKWCSYVNLFYLTWIGKNTLTIMCIHQSILYIFLFIARKFITNPYWLTGVITVITFAVTLAAIPIANYIYSWVISKMVPAR